MDQCERASGVGVLLITLQNLPRRRLGPQFNSVLSSTAKAWYCYVAFLYSPSTVSGEADVGVCL